MSFYIEKEKGSKRYPKSVVILGHIGELNIPILRATRALDSPADVFKKKLEAFQGFAF